MRGRNHKKISLYLLCAIVASLFYTPFGLAATVDTKSVVSGDSPPYAAGELIVKFKPTAARQKTSAIKGRLSLHTVENLPISGCELVKIGQEISVQTAIDELNKDPDVLYAQPNYIYNSQATVNDPDFSKLWGLHNTGQDINGTPGMANIDIAAPEAWDISMGDPSIIVAVIDEGVDINHPDLAGRIWTNPGEIPDNSIDDDSNGLIDDVNGWDFYNNDKTVFDAEDLDQHGTHVAGTIAATANNAGGIAGVAPNVKIMPLKFLGPDHGETFDAIKAIQYATAKGAKVINASWGAIGIDTALQDAITASRVLFIAAAGNGGSDGIGYNNDVVQVSPGSLNCFNILSVAAVDNQGELAVFSNYGLTSVDVGAPGVDIYSLKPVYPAMGAALKIYDTVYNYKAVHFGFGLEDLSDDSVRAQFMRRALDFLDTNASTPILLVDDDNNSPDYLPQVTSALTGYNVVNYVYAGENTNGPPLADMLGKTVVWFTGKATGNLDNHNLTVTDLAYLKSFLDHQGRLILMGDDIAYLNEPDDFFTAYMEEKVISDFTPSQTLVDSVYSGVYSLAPDPDRDTLVSKGISQSMFNYRASDPATAYQYETGTSMAAPHAAGIAALMLSVNQNLTTEQLISNLKATVNPLSSLSGKTVTGGMVNAYRAVLAVQPVIDTNPDGGGGGGGGGGGEASTPVSEVKTVVPSTGGTVSSEDKTVMVEIPQGALDPGVSLDLTAKVVELTNIKVPAPDGLKIASDIIEFGPNGKIFNKPVKITLKYNLQVVGSGEVAPYYLNESTNVWELIQNAVVDKTANTVTFETAHFSKYTVMGKPAVMQYKPFFDDIISHWAKADIEYLAAKGIVGGKSGKLFDPEGRITRAEFATMIIRALGLQLEKGNETFTDVGEKTWYYQSVETASKAGLVAGFNGKFNPNNRITRQEMATILIKALETKNKAVTGGSEVLNKFEDNAKVSKWAVPALAKAVKAGIINGKTSVKVAPLDDATRAEAAVMIRKLLEVII
ncbi:MAG: S8 family serine peptidase [Eubacteriales bacterium]